MRVVIAGAGFAGLRVAKDLEAHAEVTLVTPRPRFVFRPLIHELLSDRETPESVSKPLSEILSDTRIIAGEVVAVVDKEAILADGERIPFDQFVCAVGGGTNDFGIPGVKEHTHSFYTVDDALEANAAIKQAAAGATGPVRVAIGGASFTGVEVAGEASELLDRLAVPHQITLVEAMPQIFPHQQDGFRDGVRKGLDRLDMTLLLDRPIQEVEPGCFHVDGPEKTIEADVLLWCAGIKGHAVAGVDPEVRPTLQSRTREDIWVLGDAAVFPRDAMVPKLAQTAEKQAPVVAYNIRHPGAMKSYRPRVRGLIVSIGSGYAVAELTDGPVLTGTVPYHIKKRLYKAKIAMF